MSFGAVKPLSQPRKLMNISGQDTSSNQQAIAVSYFAGYAKIPLTWISPIYNLRAKAVKSASAGGKASSKGATAPAQKKYTGDICGVACVCPDDFPVDVVMNVLVNDEVAFSGPLNRTAGQHYAAFSLQKYCQSVRVWWGTKDSPFDDHILGARSVALVGGDNRDKSTWDIDTSSGGTVVGGEFVSGVVDPRSGHYDTHPAYRNVCRFTFKTFHFGSSPNMPNVVVIIGRKAKLFAGSVALSAQGVNPMGPAYEVLTDDLFGAGMPDAKLDQTSFTNAATANDNSGIKIAPLVTQATSLRTFMAQLLEYYNGFFRTKGLTLEAGVFLTGNFDQSALLTLGSDDLAGEPQISPGSLDHTFNYFAVVFRNRAHWVQRRRYPGALCRRRQLSKGGRAPAEMAAGAVHHRRDHRAALRHAARND